MKNRKSIALIILYFGKVPWYFNYFTYSCGFNPDIDFYIITDDKSYNKPLSKNIHLFYKTLEEINKLASSKLGFETNITSGYKLCDFKPTYGLLFPEIIERYDFWGHGDLDIIYGNIRNFMTEDVLNNFDIISVRDDYLTGFFTLFRNNEICNRLFMNSKDFQMVLSSSGHFCFDETNFSHRGFETGLHYSDVKSDVESMTHVVKKYDEKKIIRAYFDFHVIEATPGKMIWNNGELIYNNKFEAMLYHLIQFKKVYKPSKLPKNIPNKFRISKSRIY